MKENLVQFFAIILQYSKKGDEVLTALLAQFFFLYKITYVLLMKHETHIQWTQGLFKFLQSC